MAVNYGWRGSWQTVGRRLGLLIKGDNKAGKVGEVVMLWDYDTEQTVGISRDENCGKVTITYVDIVYCKDCKHGVKSPTFRYYPEITWCNKQLITHNDKWYCADGERK